MQKQSPSATKVTISVHKSHSTPQVTFNIDDFIRLLTDLARRTSVTLDEDVFVAVNGLSYRFGVGDYKVVKTDHSDLMALGLTELQQMHISSLRADMFSNKYSTNKLLGKSVSQRQENLIEKWKLIRQCCDLFDIIFLCVQNDAELGVEWK